MVVVVLEDDRQNDTNAVLHACYPLAFLFTVNYSALVQSIERSTSMREVTGSIPA